MPGLERHRWLSRLGGAIALPAARRATELLELRRIAPRPVAGVVAQKPVPGFVPGPSVRRPGTGFRCAISVRCTGSSVVSARRGAGPGAAARLECLAREPSGAA